MRRILLCSVFTQQLKTDIHSLSQNKSCVRHGSVYIGQSYETIPAVSTARPECVMFRERVTHVVDECTVDNHVVVNHLFMLRFTWYFEGWKREAWSLLSSVEIHGYVRVECRDWFGNDGVR